MSAPVPPRYEPSLRWSFVALAVDVAAVVIALIVCLLGASWLLLAATAIACAGVMVLGLLADVAADRRQKGQ